MNVLNIEIKAWCGNPNYIEKILLQRNARFAGIDHQVDTYFHSPDGRLKLREGNIEKSLIQYNRIESKDLKKSEVLLFKPQGETTSLKKILEKTLGIKVVVDKERKIYFIDNVKFHLDTIDGLGSFVEIEAIDDTLQLGEEKLKAQCQKYIELFKIRQNELIDRSYSDMVLELNRKVRN